MRRKFLREQEEYEILVIAVILFVVVFHLY